MLTEKWTLCESACYSTRQRAQQQIASMTGNAQTILKACVYYKSFVPMLSRAKVEHNERMD